MDPILKVVGFLIVIFGITAVLSGISKKKNRATNKQINQEGEKKHAAGRVIKRNLLSNSELKMFNLLCATLPNHMFNIWPQMSFQALIDEEKGSEFGFRNTFNKKVADFVIVRPNMEVVCIVELDDWSHFGRENEDAKREKLLTDAGYRVVRFKKIPEANELRTKVFTEN